MPKVIHNLYTTSPYAVDNPQLFIHSCLKLSTETVDNGFGLWIKTSAYSYMEDLDYCKTIQSVDKPVDKRGKICG